MSGETETAVARVPQAEMKTGSAIAAFVPKNLDEAWRLATIIAKSGMAPKGIDTAEKAMVCIMHGQEVGFTPMGSLQSIAPINGRATIWGDGALGLVQGSGKMEWIKETISGEGDARAATCQVKRKGDVEVKTAMFSVADAKKAKLWTKTGPWSDYPERMLKMRARSWALRDGFSDVLKGLGIAEEVRDIEEVSHRVTETAPLDGPGHPVQELKMPGLIATPAAPATDAALDATPPPAADPIDPGPRVTYLDRVVNVLTAPKADETGKIKYGIQTKALGSKKLLGTYDEAMVAVAKQAKADGVAVDIEYDQEEGKKPVLVSIARVEQ